MKSNYPGIVLLISTATLSFWIYHSPNLSFYYFYPLNLSFYRYQSLDYWHCPSHTLPLLLFVRWCFRVGMRLRSSVTTSVYQKALVISAAAMSERTTGEISNLMSVDASRLQVSLLIFMNIDVKNIISTWTLFQLYDVRKSPNQFYEFWISCKLIIYFYFYWSQ